MGSVHRERPARVLSAVVVGLPLRGVFSTFACGRHWLLAHQVVWLHGNRFDDTVRKGIKESKRITRSDC
ncbi:hypothetical protein JOF56_003538 [Kibdelosporangium banguiense]|uniref:Secreted protein n=1 Tax=Kibdelosporangium banguiense TaxID=1365924 RepID=A0ABS4TH19_9PSEU|nr:hypothetical protein [Kibdelosporangium banguiense]